MTRQRGFTLIEVLLALLVFGLIATTAAQVGSQYISSYESIRDKTLAAWLADDRMNQLRLEEELPGIAENTTEVDYGPYRWRVTTAVQGTEEPTMRRVDIHVALFRGEAREAAPVHTLSGFIGEH